LTVDGSGGDAVRRLWPHVPWQQLGKAVHRMRADAGDHVAQVGLGLEAVEFGRSDQRIEQRGALAAGVAARKEPVLRTELQRPDLVLGGVKACEDAGISVTLPKRQTSGAKAEGRFGKQNFVYKPEEDAYLCPAGEMLPDRFTNVQDGKTVHRYWTHAYRDCRIKSLCTPSKERRVIRWEHEVVLEKVQARFDHNPDAMTMRRSTVEHPFGTIKMRMGATHFLCMTLPKVATEMALNVLAYNMKRVMNIMGVDKLLEAMRAVTASARSNFARVRWLQDAFRRSQGAIWLRIAAICQKNRLGAAVQVG
jgi:hypothetical protein